MTATDKVNLQNFGQSKVHLVLKMVKPRKAAKPKEEALELSSTKQLPEGALCFACSDDGRYLSIGHSQGVWVWCASSLNFDAEWLNDTLEVTSIQMIHMAEAAYLLGTIDDMGVARIFAYHSKSIHLLSVVNAMDDINRKQVCSTFELSQGGHYGAATITCNGNVWLEVHHLPSENWLKELEKAVTSMQESKSSRDMDVKWSPLPAATKIKLPKIRGSTSEGLHEVHVTDFKTHCLSIDEDARRHWLGADAESKHTSESARCTQHFLLPCGQFLVDSKALTEWSVAICVWWTGSLNLLHYSLQKTPTHRSDHEPMPDMVWPNAKEILCSAVSRCTRYVALGLEDALVCVWDRQTGSPLSVVLMSATDSPLFRMQFVDLFPVSDDEVHLSVVCKSGAIHTVTTGRGTPPRTVLLAERPKTSGDLPTIVTSVPFLQNMFLVVQRNGKIFLQDVVSKTTVCFLKPPKTNVIASSCIPVYDLNTRQQMLFIRGDSSYKTATEILFFRFGEWDIFKPYIDLPADSVKQDTFSFVTLEESCNLYLQQRALSAEERSKAITQTWEQLQETVTTETERS
ncbi:WD repeat-containing protein 93 [Solea senegalensis]|uniref:WD repeat-containing protein 93 n=2 Tax=Solea senegalensis TaxID=28829 RepID=A0AAV6Q7A1_SOLSE|nr:WD repeat-containing protein 93 [Solea senegalensis]